MEAFPPLSSPSPPLSLPSLSYPPFFLFQNQGDT